MIALPGLTLATGRADDCRRILLHLRPLHGSGHVAQPVSRRRRTLAYNTADATLWYVQAWRAYVEASSDTETLAQVFPILQEIIAWHVAGARYGIGIDPNDGLLRAGEPGTQLTWMDAKVGDWVVTPRDRQAGRNQRPLVQRAAQRGRVRRQLGQSPTFYDDLADQTRQGFRRFVKPDGEGCSTCWTVPTATMPASGPTRFSPCSLPHSPLDHAARQAVVRVCGRELLTSYGLRSLAPRHAEFRPYYRGDVRERDGGYHQGPVWAWLLGRLRPGRIPDSRSHGGGASLAEADPRSSAGRWPGHGQRDFRRCAAASSAWRAGAGLVGGLRAGSLAATGTIEGRGLPTASGGGLSMKPRSG